MIYNDDDDDDDDDDVNSITLCLLCLVCCCYHGELMTCNVNLVVIWGYNYLGMLLDW
jgi:hypothetical protein